MAQHIAGQEQERNKMLLRYSLRELLWLMLVVGVASGWWVEAGRANQWRQRAEIAAGQLEAEKMGKIVFEPHQVVYLSPEKDPEFQRTVYPTDPSR